MVNMPHASPRPVLVQASLIHHSFPLPQTWQFSVQGPKKPLPSDCRNMDTQPSSMCHPVARPMILPQLPSTWGSPPEPGNAGGCAGQDGNGVEPREGQAGGEIRSTGADRGCLCLLSSRCPFQPPNLIPHPNPLSA